MPRRVVTASVATAVTASVVVAGPAAVARADFNTFTPGNLLVSTSQWQQDASITPGTTGAAGVTELPPGCTVGTTATPSSDPCIGAEADGGYPEVFNNAGADASFGVTQPIVLDEVNPSSNAVVSQTTVPNSSQGLPSSADQMVTSYSSKSEIALNQSTDGNYVTFMGYNAPVGAIDVSNSNTPGDNDPTNPVTGSDYRVVAALDQFDNFKFTESNAYNGNNGRAAIWDPETNSVFTAGNAGNGANPEPQTVVDGVGSQIMPANFSPESSQTPGEPTPLGNFNVTQLGDAADKSAKDDNFRGLAAYNGVLYFTKGSGSNGVNTVYFLDTTGTACPSGGVGVPSASASLPVAGSFTSPTFTNSNSALGLTASNPGLAPTNMCILSGFPTVLAKSAPKTGVAGAFSYPFGIWFANSTTMYVADEGSGDATYSATTGGPLGQYTIAAGQTNAGLQKWSFNGTKWVLDYTLQSGLNLGQPYTVAGYPTGTNSYNKLSVTSTGTVTSTAASGPWAPAVDGLRNLTGKVNGDGTVTLYAVTSTVSGSGDQGADPNALVSITDNLSDSTLPSGEQFSTVLAPTDKQVIRGVSFVPVTSNPGDVLPEVPWLPLIPVAAVLGGGAVLFWHRRLRIRAGGVS